MKLVTYNIQFGRGKDMINDLDRIASEVDGADIICLQEVDRYWQRSGDVDQAQWFTNHFPHYHVEYGAGVNICADSRDDDGRINHRRQQFGNMTLSRFPLAYCRHHLLPKYASTGPISIQRSALECIVQINQRTVRVLNTHLTHLSSETRAPQVNSLLSIHNRGTLDGSPVCGDLSQSYWQTNTELPQPPLETICVGDFNFEPGSDNYTAMTGPVSDYGGRIINPSGFMDARVAAGHEENAGATSDVQGRRAKLDHIFISPSLADLVQDCWIDDEAQGSDHEPLWLKIEL